jgi:hypothetical protein
MIQQGHCNDGRRAVRRKRRMTSETLEILGIKRSQLSGEWNARIGTQQHRAGQASLEKYYFTRNTCFRLYKPFELLMKYESKLKLLEFSLWK